MFTVRHVCRTYRKSCKISIKRRRHEESFKQPRLDYVSLENKAWYWKNRDSILKQYKGNWIAVEEGRVTCAHRDYSKFLDELNKVEANSPYVALCGAEDYTFPVLPVDSNDVFLDRFVPGEVRHPDEYKALRDFKPFGFFKQSKKVSPVDNYIEPPYRPFLTLPIKPTSNSDHVYPVTFLTDTGAPQTYLSSATISALDMPTLQFTLGGGSWTHIGNKRFLTLSSTDDRFKDINLLGTDVLYKGVLTVDFPSGKLLFSSNLLSL